jgi:hypothetical protein
VEGGPHPLEVVVLRIAQEDVVSRGELRPHDLRLFRDVDFGQVPEQLEAFVRRVDVDLIG